MKYDAQLFKVISKEQVGKDVFDIVVENPELCKLAKPGQFAHIKVEGKTLRRPISICNADDTTMRLVFAIKGEGTDILSKVKVGEYLDIISPLGNGFKIDKDKKYCFVGGGIGVPPLLFAAKYAIDPIVITGFRDEHCIILQEDFIEKGAELVLTTDDGSKGIKCFVTDVLEEKIKEVDEVCACGPMPMLEVISEICKRNNKPCQASLEERMGCGVGACLVCACKIKTKDSEEYKHVCIDGPVFDLEKVVF